MKQLIRKIKTVESMKFRVHTTQSDIEDGECRLATRCMEKVAIARTLKKHLDLSDDETRRLHVRVDAGHIVFNYGGHRWQADTPKVAADALKQFDLGKHRVRPHSFTINAAKKGKVQPLTPERAKQIRVARATRVPDRTQDPERLTLRKRIVGYSGA